MIKKIINRFYSPFFRQLNKPEYLKLIERAYKSGYSYHQKMVKIDPDLLSWVIKDYYYDNNP